MSNSGKIPISVIIMTKNEQRVLSHTLSSVKDFDQVFVVDSDSQDDTCMIAKREHAEVVQFRWDGRYPKKKEWSLLNLPFRHEWILYLDADEIVTTDLTIELRNLMVGPPKHDAYDVDLGYFFLGKRLRYGHRVTKRVLLRRHMVSWPHIDDLDVVNMWEVEGHYQPAIDGSVGHLRSRLEHNDRDPLFDYFARHNRYSDWEAHLSKNVELLNFVKGARSARGGRYANLPFKPAIFFIYSYIARRGFLDGRAGLHYAMANSFYFWQTSVKILEQKLNSGLEPVTETQSDQQRYNANNP